MIICELNRDVGSWNFSLNGSKQNFRIKRFCRECRQNPALDRGVSLYADRHPQDAPQSGNLALDFATDFYQSPLLTKSGFSKPFLIPMFDPSASKYTTS
jgi:hypothetical protein